MVSGCDFCDWVYTSCSVGAFRACDIHKLPYYEVKRSRLYDFL